MAQPNWHRICVGCGTAKSKTELLRIVRRAGNSLEIDWEKNKPGRGAYLCQNQECARSAFQRKGLDRSFRMPVPSQFYAHLIQQIERHEK